MELPEDDVGVELMNERFREMGILLEDEEGYRIDPAFVERINRAVEGRIGSVPTTDPRYREAVIEELQGMGIPAGFEAPIANWVVHAKRLDEWDAE